MKERGIIFQGWGVRSILDGTKTQTRRLPKVQPTNMEDERRLLSFLASCPYGKVGDLLWVRETWGEAAFEEETVDHVTREMALDAGDPEYEGMAIAGPKMLHEWVAYRATEPDAPVQRWRPSIYMPRRSSRLTLRITDLGAQRLHGMTNGDAEKEGLPQREYADAIYDFARLWDSINKKRAPWSSNPWVWAITFEVAR